MATCWAFDRNMRRCSLTAGHRGNHQLTISWSDDECFNPLEAPQVIASNPELEYDPAPVVEAQPERCIACTHMHTGGTCKCGCYEHI